MAKTNTNVKWHVAYKFIAERLQEFYKKNKVNSGKQLFKLCIDNIEFTNKNKWIDKFQPRYNVESLDPFHIFSSFNASGLSDEKRIDRINVFLNAIASSKFYNSIDFTGCPTPFVVKMVGARKEEVQREIWDVFQKIMRQKHKALNQQVFDKLPNWYGINISSFTIFLFWIDSDDFLPLDENTNKFLIEANIYSKKPNDYKSYKNLVPKQGVNIYREIAKNAYDFKDHTLEGQMLLRKVADFLNRNASSKIQETNFKIIAIRPLDGISPKFLKVLIKDDIYTFYNCYDFSDLERIKYLKEKDVKLYSIKGLSNTLDINISAIVGKNGSGKSSITELFYLAINNFAKSVLGNKCELEMVQEIKVELYFYINTLYKIQIDSDIVSVLKYENHTTYFSTPTEISIVKDELASFFYTIAVNYSHHSLNSLEIGNWIQHLFHKNDGYEVPLVINPMRTLGNYNINTENGLAKTRLLANILEPISDNIDDKNLREITENGRSAKTLLLTLNLEKVKYLYDKHPFPSVSYQSKILKKVYTYFDVRINNKNDITRCADKYIYKKLVNISRTYFRYRKYVENGKELKIKLLDEYLKKLKDDNSHIAYKLKQAINFLKYTHLKHHDIDKPLDVEILSNNIENVIEKNLSIEKLETILLVPPSFFKIEILLNDNSNFDYLSSGEKQRIHIVNSLIYHLYNINSVSENQGSVKYSYVNILFDEIELYFHPEMQRTFISYLIGCLKKIRLEDIIGLNFCFVTHSPFILSDIPANNILFLNIDGKPKKDIDKLKTFGANIHDLLSDSFFLEKGFIGKFAEEKINSVINWCNEIDDKLTEQNTISQEERLSTDEAKQIIDIIDDPIIKIKLIEMFAKKVGKNFEIARLTAQKDFISEKLKQLGHND
ncbi:MAG: hypothetical protein JWN83_1266 [Chitinophagaceae bacterium]|nr:hypothetical protein [Chitinophagaceae bacterium]